MAGHRLYIDIQTIQSLRFGDRGIPRLATELSRALLAQGAPVAALALNPLVPWPRRIHPDLERAPQLVWNTATAFRRALREGPLISFVISPFEGAHPVHATLAAHVTGVPEVVMVHDLIPDVFGYDPDSSWGRVYERRRAWVRRADVIVTPSENTRHDVARYWAVDPARIAVIGEAASPFFSRPQPSDDPASLLRRRLPGITHPFVLSVSGPDAHKNTDVLFDAWARTPASARRQHQLVVTCTLPDDTRRRWIAHADDRGIGADELVLTGFVDDDVLRALYQQASLLVLASSYEGFGLPVLEAIGCGCPAITSNVSSLPEVLDWPGATFSPSDTDEISGLINRALSDSEYRSELERRCGAAAERHTWPRVVERLLAACARVPDSPRTRPRRRRVALVGPFPPSPSWIAAHNARLATALAQRSAVDCFVEPFDAGADGSRPPGAMRVFPASSLGPTFTPAAYDIVLYTIGTARDEVFRLARTYPGVVWLHDLALADRELLGCARGIIVSSPDALDVVRAGLDLRVDARPTWVVPLAVSDSANAQRDDRGKGYPPSFDDVAREVLAIADFDLEPARPSEASALVTRPTS